MKQSMAWHCMEQRGQKENTSLCVEEEATGWSTGKSACLAENAISSTSSRSSSVSRP
jgi:hypothetical protein